MLESVKVICHQIIEAFAEGGVKNIFRPRVFWNRVAIPVVMELSTSKSALSDYLIGTDFQFSEINIKDLQAGKWSFATPSRKLKALRNLKRGFRSFAITENSVVVGNVWCLTPRKDGQCISHPDLDMLGIICGEADSYAFDMFIAPAYRGKNLAAPLQKLLHASLSDEGCEKVYGYYWDDNLPALWTHRILKFKELPKRCVSRFFFLVKSREIDSAGASYKNSQKNFSRRPHENNRNSKQGETENADQVASQTKDVCV
jgi:GNAT superfamily N-acetyltransferase